VPTYQYACTSCGERLEVVQSFTADPLTECPRCGGRLRKVFSPVGVVFKGSGFYKTDSRSERKPAAAAKPDGAGREGADRPAAAADGAKAADAKTGDGKVADSKPAGDTKPAAGDAKPAGTGSGKPKVA